VLCLLAHHEMNCLPITNSARHRPSPSRHTGPRPYLREREHLADAQLHNHPCENNSLIAKPAAWVAFRGLRSGKNEGGGREQIYQIASRLTLLSRIRPSRHPLSSLVPFPLAAPGGGEEGSRRGSREEAAIGSLW
jgi:hypothetical protein